MGEDPWLSATEASLAVRMKIKSKCALGTGFLCKIITVVLNIGRESIMTISSWKCPFENLCVQIFSLGTVKTSLSPILLLSIV